MVVTVDDNGVCTHASMRGGALGRYPMHFADCEALLVGKKLSYAAMLETLPIMHDQILEATRLPALVGVLQKRGRPGRVQEAVRGYSGTAGH